MTNEQIAAAFQRMLEIIHKKYEAADTLAQQGQFEEALRGFMGILEWVAEKKFPIPLEPFQDILTRIGLCYANLLQHEDALQYYQAIEAILLDWKEAHSPEGVDSALGQNPRADIWKAVVPPGLRYQMPDSFDPLPFLANIYDSLALCYEYLGNKTQAEEYYGQAVELNQELGQPDRAIHTLFLAASLRQQNEDWQGLAEIAEAMAILSERADNTDQHVQALRFLTQAHLNLENDFAYLETLTAAVRLGNRNDPAVAQDRELLRETIEMLIPHAEAENDPRMWKPLLEAARLIGHPDLAQLEALTSKMPGMGAEPRVAKEASGPVISPQAARLVLERFAVDHCGPAKATQGKGLFGKLRALMKDEPEEQWRVLEGALTQTLLTPEGVLEELTLNCVYLMFVTKPVWMVRVSFPVPEEMEVHLLLHHLVKQGPKETACWISYVSTKIPATASKLMGLLNHFIKKDMLLKGEGGLRPGKRAEAVKAKYLSNRN